MSKQTDRAPEDAFEDESEGRALSFGLWVLLVCSGGLFCLLAGADEGPSRQGSGGATMEARGP